MFFAVGLITDDYSVIREAVKHGQRPDPNAITGPEALVQDIKVCIERCWDQSPDSRPSFAGSSRLDFRFVARCVFTDRLIPASKLRLHIVFQRANERVSRP